MKNDGVFERGLNAIRHCTLRKANEGGKSRIMTKGNYAESGKVGINE